MCDDNGEGQRFKKIVCGRCRQEGLFIDCESACPYTTVIGQVFSTKPLSKTIENVIEDYRTEIKELKHQIVGLSQLNSDYQSIMDKRHKEDKIHKCVKCSGLDSLGITNRLLTTENERLTLEVHKLYQETQDYESRPVEKTLAGTHKWQHEDTGRTTDMPHGKNPGPRWFRIPNE